MSAPLLQVENLSKSFPSRRGFLAPAAGPVRAVDSVSFTVSRGEAFAIVGESGCGKSTVGRALLRLIEPDAGAVRFDGVNLIDLAARDLRPYRRRLQMIFQDPYSSLNPRRSIGQTLAEPLRVHGVVGAEAIEQRVIALLAEVGLPPEARTRYPHEFSGGQRQRIGIARALALEPQLIVADEPVSALDVSIQAQVLVLLRRLMRERGLAFVFISHDLAVVRYFCQRVAVMYLGRMVEQGPVADMFDAPLHPYTRMLRDASPVPDPVARRAFTVQEGEIPSAMDPPPGCHFHPRCPHAMPVCRTTQPDTIDMGGGRSVACHLYPSPPEGSAA